jgi:hypothetical protein
MVHRMARYTLSGLVVSLPALVSTPAWAEATTWEKPSPWFVYAVIFIVLVGSLLALLFIRAALSDSKWSLADALSEEAEVTAMTTKDGKAEAVLDDSKKPIMITEMCASTSRLIALMGMIVILLMFLAFGAFALYSFANTGKMPDDINKVISFLVAGLTLFAPYVVNKFSAMFESLSPKKS